MSIFTEQQDVTPATAWDTQSMVEVLEGRHGTHAASVADFFASYHGISGRRDRARSWSNVATLVRRREHQRLSA
jgi:hypothetical protein